MKTYMIIDNNDLVRNDGYIIAEHLPQDSAMALLQLLLEYGHGGIASYTVQVDYIEEEYNKRKEEE